MGETAASSALAKERKYMEGLNCITQTPTPSQHVIAEEELEEENMVGGGGGGEVTAIPADSRREEELLEEDDPLQLTLSPYAHRRPRPSSLGRVEQQHFLPSPSPSPSPRQQLLLSPQPRQPPPLLIFSHQDHHHRPLSSFSSTPTPLGGYPPKVVHLHHHLPAMNMNHDALAHLPAGMGTLLPNSVPLLAAANANTDQSGGGGGGGARASGASASTTSTSTSTASAAAASATASSSSSSNRSSSNRRNPNQAPRGSKDDKVPPPFDWATDRRATVHSLVYLRSKGIRSISGEVQCKRCESQYRMEYDVESKFLEMEEYIRMHKSTMHDRAPKEWMTPKLPDCQKCGQQDCVKPIISIKKRSINWLFLLLGKMLGCCTLEQLRYFCKHTKNHRTGAKDRVLYLTYLALCKQLHPDGPFDR